MVSSHLEKKEKSGWTARTWRGQHGKTGIVHPWNQMAVASDPSITAVQLTGPGKFCGPLRVRFLPCKMGMASLSQGGLAQGRHLSNVSSPSILYATSPPPSSIHTTEKSRHCSMRKYSLFPSTVPLFPRPSQTSRTGLPSAYLLTLSPAVTARSHGKPRNLKGNQSCTSQLAGGSGAHPCGLQGREPNWSCHTLPLWGAGGPEGRPQVFFQGLLSIPLHHIALTQAGLRW